MSQMILYKSKLDNRGNINSDQKGQNVSGFMVIRAVVKILCCCQESSIITARTHFQLLQLQLRKCFFQNSVLVLFVVILVP